MQNMESAMIKDLPTPARHSPATEDYAKAIYLLAQEHERVTTSLLAERLGFAAASITGMLQKLAKQGLVTYTPYHGVVLAPEGQRIALEVLRHHRLLETFLVQALDFSWDEVHTEAEVLEHSISERLEARIAERLGNPSADPHGDPIPAPDLTLPAETYQPLGLLPIGAEGEIVRVTDQHAEHLRYLKELHLLPGVTVRVSAKAPFDGPVTIAVGDTLLALDSRLARSIMIRTTTMDEEGRS
jgi:DtxR family Mn-dependent transcriptional regulator